MARGIPASLKGAAAGREAAAGLGDFVAPIGAELAAVEKLFHEELASDLAPINALVKHVSRFRGKMLRPVLVLLAGKACMGDRAARAGANPAANVSLPHELIVLATVVEMVHMATLVHDDVLDEAELRRKGATINHLRGNEAAVMLGDYLISHSYHLCASLDSQLASRLISRTTNRVCEGELLQIDNRNNLELDEKTYLTIIERKTASLCAICCYLGAHFAGASDDVARRLELYGLSLGTAFQIQDDILDIVGDVRTVGKTLGIDVEKGKLTLPMIHFMQTAPAEHRELLRSLLTSRDADKAERIRNLILPSQSIHYARDRAASLIARAGDAIADLPPSQAKDVLLAMAEFVVNRPM